MARGVVFSHPNIKGDLVVRLAPTDVQWSYQLNTSVQNTYGGQVVQVLSVAFDKLTITGKFGKEGPHGVKKENGRYVRRTSSDWNTKYTYGVGLIQMTEWFKEYFQLASQGEKGSGSYNEKPVSVTYQGGIGKIPVDEGKSEIKWQVYPVSFPSYKRSNEDFAPEWRIECEVYEAPGAIKSLEKDTAIDRLKRASLYTPMNKYSDPIAQFLPESYQSKNAAVRNKLIDDALARASERLDATIDFYTEMIPALDIEDIRYLLNQGGSLANDITQDKKPKTTARVKEAEPKASDPYRDTDKFFMGS